VRGDEQEAQAHEGEATLSRIQQLN
jgi:hypothetical protein